MVKIILFQLILIMTIIPCSTKPNYGIKLTSDNIMKLEQGMAKVEVIEIVGKPIGDTVQDYWTMTEKKEYFYCMVWIEFTKDSLSNVTIKNYHYFDGVNIYQLSTHKPSKYRDKIYFSDVVGKYL